MCVGTQRTHTAIDENAGAPLGLPITGTGRLIDYLTLHTKSAGRLCGDDQWHEAATEASAGCQKALFPRREPLSVRV
jgi:hypothetical protein